MTDDNKVVQVELPAGITEDDMDDFREQAEKWNAWGIRTWLTVACEDADGKCVGGGIGIGNADIDIEYEGRVYNIQIKPYPPKKVKTDA